MLRVPVDMCSNHFSKLASHEGLNSVRAQVVLQIHFQTYFTYTLVSPEVQQGLQFINWKHQKESGKRDCDKRRADATQSKIPTP